MNKAIQLLRDIPDDMDYPTDEEFRKKLNEWYWENVAPFLKEVDDNSSRGDEALERYIEVAKRMSEKGTYYWWQNLEKLLIELKEFRNEKDR